MRLPAQSGLIIIAVQFHNVVPVVCWHLGGDTRSIPLVHRDVKSLNVLLTRDMRAKIADFGDSAMQAVHSKLQASDLNKERSRTSFHTKNRHGTAAWMAPEALTLEGLTSAVDVFSFGAGSSAKSSAHSLITAVNNADSASWFGIPRLNLGGDASA